LAGREKAIWLIGALLLSGWMLAQFIPIWRLEPSMDPRNPPVKHSLYWSSPEADALMHNICYECHSNETVYPIYTRIAPVSWIAAQHVNEGRSHLNFSEQPLEAISPDLLIAYIQADLMPPPLYRSVHPEANLTPAQKIILIEGIRHTFAANQASVARASALAPAGRQCAAPACPERSG
jgi:hypothetical protein